MSRRGFLLAGAAFAGVGAIGGLRGLTDSPAQAGSDSKTFEFTLTEAEWKARLSPQQFTVLRNHGTEYAYSSPLLNEKREGTYKCAGCDLALYESKDKFDSGTGWPSFTRALPNAVGTQRDTSFFMIRTEVHCSRCGGHLGHIFDDGPAPTGKRHCINGVSLTFQTA